jgi:hypothetical protein
VSSDEYGAGLFPQHQALLVASRVSPEVAREREYASVDQHSQLVSAGFARSTKVSVPGLLQPRWLADGRRDGVQYRPDVPRIDKNGKPRKYENPYGQGIALDVHPRSQPLLRDVGIPLWVPEGQRKGDSLVTAGLCAVALCGVDCWGRRGTALPDWREVALEGREVVIAFDSDVVVKTAVQGALHRFSGYLEWRGARVRYCHLPDDEGKCGVDDFLYDHSLDDLLALVSDERPRPKQANQGFQGQTSFPSGNGATAQPPPPAPSEPPGIAYQARILDLLRAEVRLQGLVGEYATAATTYLAITSRFLPRPVSQAVKGHSSSGKSFAVQTTLRFFPPEAYLEMTGMSSRALVYLEDDYRHRTIVVYEAEALREDDEHSLVSYFVRSLLSEGQIRYPVTVRGPDGSFTAKTITKEGPTNIIFTTTRAAVHYENETRVLSIQTDDSREQTALIFAALAEDADAEGADRLGDWISLQRWLAAGEHRVAIPYAGELAALVPPVAIRLRRDFGAVLALIRTHAILHQVTRDRDGQGRIVATLDDYEVVRELIADVISQGVGHTVSDTVRETVAAVTVLAPNHPTGVTAAAVAARLRLDRSTASRRLSVAGHGGYVRNLEDRKGRSGRWEIAEPLPEARALLPPACDLRCNPSTVAPQGEEGGGCAVATPAQEEPLDRVPVDDPDSVDLGAWTSDIHDVADIIEEIRREYR